MKSILIFVPLLFIFGCSGNVDTAVVATAAGTGIVKGVSDYYAQQAEQALTRMEIAQKRLDTAATEAEKQAAEAELIVAQKEAADAQIKSDATKTITSVDWTTTGGASAGAAVLSNLLTQWYFKRKKS